jgi:hypothetical protein
VAVQVVAVWTIDLEMLALAEIVAWTCMIARIYSTA